MAEGKRLIETHFGQFRPASNLASPTSPSGNFASGLPMPPMLLKDTLTKVRRYEGGHRDGIKTGHPRAARQGGMLRFHLRPLPSN